MIARHRERMRRFDAALGASKNADAAYRKAVRTGRPDLVEEAKAAHRREQAAWDAYGEAIPKDWKKGGHHR